MRGPGGAVINYLLGAQLDGPMVLLAAGRGRRARPVPGLRVVTVETGAAWLGWIMTQADAIYEDHIMYARPKLSLKPSELIRRQGHATFMYDPVAINNRHITGVETIMWGNDYPHPEGTWPSSQEIAAKQFADVPDDELRAIVGGTAAAVFGFDLAVLCERADMSEAERDAWLRGRTAIVGIGHTPWGKRGEHASKGLVRLVVEAITKACDDAGISPKDIDGYASYVRCRWNRPSCTQRSVPNVSRTAARRGVVVAGRWPARSSTRRWRLRPVTPTTSWCTRS